MSRPRPLPGAENAGKPGYYTIKPGDTLIRIGLENGQNWRDIARWNNLDNPNLVEVGQVVRVVPPGVDPAAPASRAVAAAKVESRPARPQGRRGGGLGALGRGPCQRTGERGGAGGGGCAGGFCRAGARSRRRHELDVAGRRQRGHQF